MIWIILKMTNNLKLLTSPKEHLPADTNCKVPNCPFTVSTTIMTDKEMETAAQEFWEDVEKKQQNLKLLLTISLQFYCP